MALTRKQVIKALKDAYAANKHGGWTLFLFVLLSEEEVTTLEENGWIELNDSRSAYTVTIAGQTLAEAQDTD